MIAGTDLSQQVTLELAEIPLKQAMETALRITGKGLMEEEGIYHIVPYTEAISAGRQQRLITLENAKATDVQAIIEATIVGTRNASHVSITANAAAQLVVISAPENRMPELVDLVRQLDIAPQVSPTEIRAIKLNFASPTEIATAAQALLTQGTGTVSANANTRHVIVNDLPVVLKQIEELVAQLDVPVKRVAIDAMLVDVSLSDDAETGVDWLFNAVQQQSRSQANLGQPGNVRGRLQNISMMTPFGLGPAASALSFGILGNKFDLRGVIQAEIRNRNGRLISNPQLVTIENQAATLEIVQEIPYVELTATEAGGQQTSTSFKDVGTTLTVTPRVTHDDQIIATINVKESDAVGEFNGIPIEDQRTIDTTVRMQNGETVFMAGARKKDMDSSVRKLPFLGDIPVVNFLFRQNVRTESVRELLVFLTCSVIADNSQISPYQEEQFSDANEIEIKVDGQRGLFRDMVHPEEMRDPAWKWRRTD